MKDVSLVYCDAIFFCGRNGIYFAWNFSYNFLISCVCGALMLVRHWKENLVCNKYAVLPQNSRMSVF